MELHRSNSKPAEAKAKVTAIMTVELPYLIFMSFTLLRPLAAPVKSTCNLF